MNLTVTLQTQSLTMSHVGVFYFLGLFLLVASAGIWKALGEKQVARGLILIISALIIILMNLNVKREEFATLPPGILVATFLVMISWAVVATTAMVQLRRLQPGKRTIRLLLWALIIIFFPIIGALIFYAFSPRGAKTII